MRHQGILNFILLAVFACAACSNTSTPQQHFTVAIVSAGDNFNPLVAGFKEGMAAAGYHEGRNITYLYDGPTPKEQISTRLAFLKQQDIDLLYTTTTPITKTAHAIFAGSGTPILFAPVFSPVEAGLIAPKTRCGNNITGVMVRGSTPNTLAFLLECAPAIKTIFVPFHQQDLPARLSLKDLRQEAAKHGIAIITADVAGKADLAKTLQNIPPAADCIWLTNSRLIVDNAAAIVDAATKRKLPVASPTAQHRNGALVTYAPDSTEMGRQASRIADKILQGTPASHIPAETADYFLGINLVKAEELGIAIRNDILRQATFIVR
ncbi:MAG: ABC transporter substrate-binding protein [Desulfobulbaceae bacterium]|nr:ABC transporter substrate-binding protein [Desulfobulbaceae bacterium]